MRTFHFNSEIARRFGVDEAIFIHHLQYWVDYNKSNEINRKEFEGAVHYWTHNSMKAFASYFQFWTEKQILRIVKSCKEKGLIISSSFCEENTGKTLWYTLTETAEKYYKTCGEDIPEWEEDTPERAEENSQTGEQNSQMGEDVDKLYNINLNNKNNNPYSNDRPKGPKAYGRYGWVKLTDKSLKKLTDEFGEILVAKAIKLVDQRAENSNNKYGWVKWGSIVRNAIEDNWGGIRND